MAIAKFPQNYGKKYYGRDLRHEAKLACKELLTRTYNFTKSYSKTEYENSRRRDFQEKRFYYLYGY